MLDFRFLDAESNGKYMLDFSFLDAGLCQALACSPPNDLPVTNDAADSGSYAHRVLESVSFLFTLHLRGGCLFTVSVTCRMMQSRLLDPDHPDGPSLFLLPSMFLQVS